MKLSVLVVKGEHEIGKCSETASTVKPVIYGQ